MKDALELVFKHSGGVEVRTKTSDPNVDVVSWSSDSDPEFQEHFGEEIMSAEDDAEDVLEYLEDQEHFTPEELDTMAIYDETEDPEDDDGDDEEDYDE